MAFGNERQGGGGKNPFVRLSGVFPTAKGNFLARIEVSAFNTVYEMMQEAAKINGTLTLIISKNKQTGKPELYGVVGKEYVPKNKQQAAAAPAGPFGQFSQQQTTPAAQQAPAPQPTVGTREVTFGQADVPKDDFDSLLESLK